MKCFSALQRAENSSTACWSDEVHPSEHRFSALQRAENSSTDVGRDYERRHRRFQCSSASRKFLNDSAGYCVHHLNRVSVLFSEPKIPQHTRYRAKPVRRLRFSALQRAENSSTWGSPIVMMRNVPVSVLFSEPKIPQHRPSHLRPSIFPTAMITLRHS